MKVLLAGSPSFSILTFSEIVKNFEVIGLIAQPSKPVGRKQIITEPPTVIFAKENNIKVYQPTNIIDIYDQLKNIEFDVLITMAYGQIVPEKILNLAKKGSYNIHASLLPKYRGAAPIQYALNEGEKETGITLIEMIKKMDAGDIIFQAKVDIEADDNLDSMLEKLSSLSASNIVSWLNAIDSNNFKKLKQDESKVTFAPKISKQDEQILLTTMEKTINKIRSLSSTPGAYILLNEKQTNQGQRVKIFRATKEFVKNGIEIKCSDGSIYAVDYQFEGKRKVRVF